MTLNEQRKAAAIYAHIESHLGNPFITIHGPTLYRIRRVLEECYRYDADSYTVIERGSYEAWVRGNSRRFSYKPLPREVLIIMAGHGKWGKGKDVRIGEGVRRRCIAPPRMDSKDADYSNACKVAAGIHVCARLKGHSHHHYCYCGFSFD